MLRAILGSMALVMLVVGSLAAGDNKTANAKARHERHGTFVKVDLVKNTVTFLTKDSNGKEREMTLPLARHAKVLGEDNKPESLDTLAKNMGKEKDKSILIIEDKDEKQIIEIKDLPSK
jgi:hypothetical protein